MKSAIEVSDFCKEEGSGCTGCGRSDVLEGEEEEEEEQEEEEEDEADEEDEEEEEKEEEGRFFFIFIGR